MTDERSRDFLNKYIALIKTTTRQTTDKIQAKLSDTHYGHTTDSRHLYLPDNVRLSLLNSCFKDFHFNTI